MCPTKIGKIQAPTRIEIHLDRSGHLVCGLTHRHRIKEECNVGKLSILTFIVYLSIFQNIEKTYCLPIRESDINDILRDYKTMPTEDRQLLQALRGALTRREYRNALDDVELSIHLDKTRDDYILKSGNGGNKIIAHRDGNDNVEIRLYDKTWTCKLRDFKDRIIETLEDLFIEVFAVLLAKGASYVGQYAKKALA